MTDPTLNEETCELAIMHGIVTIAEHPNPDAFHPDSDVGPDDDRCPACGCFHAAMLSSAPTNRRETVNEPPRRIRMDQWTPAESAIDAAVQAVEREGCDVRLTDAINLLHAARAKVADYVDERLADAQEEINRVDLPDEY
jgi:hypothetical protein